MNKMSEAIKAHSLDGVSDEQRVEVLAEFAGLCAAIACGTESEDDSYLVTVQATSLLCELLSRVPNENELARVLAPLVTAAEGVRR